MSISRSPGQTMKPVVHFSSAAARRRAKLLFEALEVRQLLSVSATPIFIDNFNQTAGSLPNTNTWNYDTGEDPNSAVSYVDNSSVMQVVNDPTASDGKALAISIQEGPVTNGTQTFTSARIDTSVDPVAGNLEYGMIEASIKLPGGPNGVGNGLWPAFWMLGADFPQVGWPESGEIDIMENKGSTPGTIQGSLHSGALNGPRMDPTSYYNLPGGQDFYNSYHLFAVEWSPGSIQFLVDGQVYSTFLESSYGSSVWNFNDHGFYVILNIADGGGFGGPLGANSTFPQTMYVDYVAAYSLTGIGTPTNLTARPITGNQVNLSWQDPSNDATGFVLQRSTSSSFATIDATFNLAQGVDVYQDTSAVAGTSYYYRIQAVSTDGTNNYQSGYSNTATATTWFDQDINTTGGSSSVASDIFTLTGQGTGIGGSSDQFNFMSDPWSGNGTAIAKLTGITNGVATSQAGLMFRDSSAANASFAAVLDTPSSGIEFAWRSADGGTASSVSISGVAAPVWMELVRTGNSFGAYYSTNDLTWIQIGTAQTVTMGATAQVGLAVSSDTTAPATATFADLSVGPNLPAAAVALNSGGTAEGTFSADADFSTSTASTSSSPIDTTGVPNPAPQAVYDTNRYGGNFTYTVPGLTAGASYDVQLQFAEEYWTAAGKRIFNVSINGTNVLSAFDIFATAGGEYKAVQEDFATTADASGTITIIFAATADNAQVNGIAIYPLGPVSPTPAPTNLTANAKSTTEIDLSWNAPTTATPNGYNIYRGTSAGGESATPLNGSPVTATTYADTTAAPGTNYFYVVKAVYTAGNSVASNEASATSISLTPAPTNLAATDKNATEIDLTWSAPSGGTPTGYSIFRGTTAGGESATPLNATPVTTTTYQDTTAASSTTYYYTVQAVYAAGNSVSSNEAHATTISLTPAVTNLAANAKSATEIDLTWSTPTGGSPTGYNVFRGTAAGGESATPLNATPITTTTYADTTAAASTTYYYTVKAIYGAGTSAASNEATATTPSTSGAVIAIDAGGAAAGAYVADVDFTGGTASSTTAAIVTTGVANPAPQAVYQTIRFGGTFSYTIPGLTPGAGYDVQLQFAETYWTAAGKRIFNVAINGTTVLSGFDIFAASGGKDIALEKDFNATADSTGKITISFTTTADNAEINGIEIIPLATTPAPIGLAASAKSSSEIDLSWNAPSGATPTGYNIYRGTAAGGESATPVNSTPVTTTTYADTTVSGGTAYFYTVKAIYAGGNSAASNEATATTPATPLASQLAFSTAAQTLTAGVASSTITVQLKDQFGNAFNAAGNTVVNLASTSGSGTFSPTSVTITAGSSTASFTYSDTAAGTPTIMASATGLTSASQQETVNAATASQIIFTTAAQTLTVGVASGTITVELKDSFGNIAVAGSGGQAITLGSTSGTGVFTPTSLTVTAGASTASFTYKDTTSGTPTITASATGLTSAMQQETVGAAAASQIVFTTAAQTLTAGVASGTITVELKDASGNVAVAGAGGQAITLASTSGTGTFTPTSITVAAGASTASFTYKDNTAGTPTITASATGLTSAMQQETVNAAAPSQIIFTTAAQTLTAGVASSTITVELKDSFGNIAKAGTGGQAITLGTTSGTGKFNPTSVTVTTGASTAGFTYTDTTAGTPTITASATDLTSASQQETVQAATSTATQIAFLTASNNNVPKGTLSPPITLQLRDKNNNPVLAPAGGTVITLTSSSNKGTFTDGNGKTITSVTVAAGTSTASFLYTDTALKVITLTASHAGLTSATYKLTISAVVNKQQIVFTSSTQTLASGVTSTTITIQFSNINGGTGSISGKVINLVTTSATGLFLNSTTHITSVTTNASGIATFTYVDTAPTAITPILSASLSGNSLVVGMQQETIT